MDLHPTDEQRQLRETLRRLLDRRLADLVEELPDPPRHDPGRALEDARAIGLFSLGLPESVGGAGGFADLAVAHEELGRGLAPPLLVTLTLAERLVVHAAGEGERAQLLADLASGRLMAAPAVEEGPDPTAPARTTVTATGDHVRVDGRKQRVVCGREVDELLVSARDTTSGTATVVAVPVDAPGMQWHAETARTDIPQWTVALHDVCVPAARRLTGDVAAALTRYRTDALVLCAAREVGGGRAVLDRTIAHVRTREQFDRPIGTFQAVQHQLADVATDLDAAALAVAQAAWAVDAGEPAVELSRFAAVAALASGAAFRRATLVAHQLHGGMGFVLDSPLHLWSARAVADPTVPLARRHVLDELAAATGVAADVVVVPPEHRVATG